MQKKILITGGAGFIGINAADYFIRDGWDVTILDNLSRKGVDFNLKWINEEHPSRISFVKVDVRYDQDILNRELSAHDAVLHLAGQVAVTTSVLDPRDDFENNVLGTINVLEAVRNAPTPPILIFASTNKVYGNLEHLGIEETKVRYDLKDYPEGISETQQLDFHSPYGCSKGAADQYVHDYGRIYNLPTVVFRQSCIYGPNQFGVEDQGWMAWFSVASLFNKPVTVYGTGKQVRDALHVKDLCGLYKSAIENIDKARGEVFNAGGGKTNSTSVLEFFANLENNHDLPVQYDFSEERRGDQKVFISDNTKAKNQLNWEPKIAFQDGAPMMIDWIKDNTDKIKIFYA